MDILVRNIDPKFVATIDKRCILAKNSYTNIVFVWYT